MSVQKIDPKITFLIFKPLLIRAGIAAIFGIVTLIVQEPSAGWVNYGLAIFFMFTGTAMWEYLRRSVIPVGLRSPLSMAAAIWMLGALSLVGVQLMDFDAVGTAIVAGAAFGLGGLAEFVAWARFRKEFAPARDQLLFGLVGIIAGGVLIMEAFRAADYHFMFGTSGAAGFAFAVIAAVAGMGYFLDTRKAIKEGFTPPEAES